MRDLWLLIACVLIFVLTLVFIIECHSAEDYTNEQIVNAIFIAEGGYKATWLYGIRSVPYKDEAEARRICFNTVRNNRVRYAQYGYKKHDTYLAFLASRYCPVGADNDNGTNQYWLRNVKSILRQKVS